jgi:hypothetical protein
LTCLQDLVRVLCRQENLPTAPRTTNGGHREPGLGERVLLTLLGTDDRWPSRADPRRKRPRTAQVS